MARKIEIEIVGDVDGFRKSLSQAAGHTDSFGSRVGSLGGTLLKMGAAAGIAAGVAGVAGLAVVIRAGITEFSEAAKVGAQTNAVLESTGGIANVSAQEVSKLAEALMRKSGVDDEAIASGQNLLLTFTNIRNEVGAGNDIFAQATAATLNLSVALGKDMASSAILVGKALNDPIKGMTALGRAGVQLTAEQKTLIKGFVETGDVMSAQKVILGELETQFGGSAEAIGKTLPGQLNILKESFSNLSGELVGKLVPAFAKAVDGVSDFVSKLSAAKGFEAKVTVVLEGAQALVSKAITIGTNVGKQIAEALGNVDWAAAGTKVAAAIGAALKTGIPKAMDLAGAMATGLLKAVDQIDWVTVGNNIGVGLKEGIKKGAKEHTISGIKSVIAAGATPSGVVAKAVGKDVGDTLGNWLGIGAKDSTKKGMATLPPAITTGLDPAIVAATSGGSRIGSGLAGGLTAALSGVGASVAATIISQISMSELQIKQKYGIHSPSEVWSTEIGKPLGEGIVKGALLGTAELPGKISGKLQETFDRARAVVEAQQGRLGDAFGKLGEYVARQFEAKTAQVLDKIGARFDAAIGKWQAYADAATPAEQALAQIDKDEAQRSRDAASRSAADALVAALAMEEGVEREKAIAAAHEQIRLADLANRRAQLEAQAVIERAHREKVAAEHIAKLEETKARELQNYLERRTQMASELDAQLGVLAARLAKHPEEYDKIHKQIVKLLATYGIPMNKAGENLGKAFAKGLRDAGDDVERAVKYLAGIVERFLKGKSPTKEGPMSTLDTWWSGVGRTLVSGLDYGAVSTAGAKLAGALAAAPSGGGGTSGGVAAGGLGGLGAGGSMELHVHINAPQFGDSNEAIARQLGPAIYNEILTQDRRRGGRLVNHTAAVLS